MIEQFIYEARPYLYLTGAFTANSYYGSAMMRVFAVLLGACMGVIIYWRCQNRLTPQKRTRR